MNPQSRQPDDNSLPRTLVESAVAGDRAALRELYERTRDRVYRLMVRMAGRQDGEDLTQQTYVRAFEKLDQFKGSAKFETWLYRIAANEALQHLRRERVRKTVPLETAPTAKAENTLLQKELAESLHVALEQLDPELRTILSLKEDSGLSYQQIAAAMDIPEGTVGSRLNRARRELAQLLADS